MHFTACIKHKITMVNFVTLLHYQIIALLQCYITSIYGNIPYEQRPSSLYLKVTLLNVSSEKLSMYGLYLQGGLHSEGVFNTGLTVYYFISYLTLQKHHLIN